VAETDADILACVDATTVPRRSAANAVRGKRPSLASTVRQLCTDLDALRARVSSLEDAVDAQTGDLEYRLDEIETAAAVRAAEWTPPRPTSNDQSGGRR
jgi:hypothetical protein